MNHQKNKLSYDRNIASLYIKETNSNINLLNEEDFFYRLKLYGEEIKYANFIESLDKINKEEGNYNLIKDRLYQLKQEIINDIKENPKFETVLTQDVNKYNFKNNNLVTKGNVFKPFNDKKRFISVDMREANFLALKKLSPGLILEKSYAEFVEKYNIPSDWKNVRQFIFGNLNPKRQIKVQKFIMNDLFEKITKELVLIPKTYLNNDELIFEANTVEEYNKIKKTAWIYGLQLNEELETSKEIFKVESFVLVYVEELDFYLKIFLNGDYEIKGLNKNYYPIIYKAIKGLPLINKDLYFYYEKHKCQFVDYPIVSKENKELMEELNKCQEK